MIKLLGVWMVYQLWPIMPAKARLWAFMEACRVPQTEEK